MPKRSSVAPPQMSDDTLQAVEADTPILSGSTGGQPKLKKWQRIFVNRSLNMGRVKAIGFDMDHTLAVYDRERFEALAFRETLKKFIEAGYPEELSALQFDPNFLIRGLLVDMERGNLLKADGHRYVKIAFHGKKRLTKDLRHKLYNSERFKARQLLSVDTFFALSEVQLFTEVVDYMDRNPDKISKTYREVYQDLRRFIDLSHADGSIKNEVLRDLPLFIRRDKHLPQTLAQLANAGKALFLITNSGWEYTNAVMTYLFEEAAKDSQNTDLRNWRDYFHSTIVGAGKPSFFVGSQPFYEVMTESGLLKLHQQGPLRPDAVYHGGNANLFQKLTGYRGDEILFVGDHIYGDIIRSKDTLNWRTMLIVEELERELPKLEELKDTLVLIRQRIHQRELLDEDLQILRSKIFSNNRQAQRAMERGDTKKAQYLAQENLKHTPKEQLLIAQIDTLDKEIKQLIEQRSNEVHPMWGELMKVGLEHSRFADQVADYACIYSASVTNLRFYSPFKRYTSMHDSLPHEL